MKKLILATICFLGIASFSTAQEMTEGYMKMEITNVEVESEEMEMMKGMLEGTETEYYFSPDKSLVKANMMGGMMVMTSIIDNTTEDMVMYFDAMGNKMEIESKKEDRDAMEEEAKKVEGADVSMEDFDITYHEDDTKEILGYKCIKATITAKTMRGINMDMYVTRDIKASHKMIREMEGYNIEGFPLEYTMSAQGMKMTYTTTDLKQELNKSVFEFDNRGYQKMTFDEFQKQMGGMSGF